MMFRWLAILSVMTLQLGSFAQDISIRGRFVSKGSAVPYASVALKGSSQGTSSDMNGHFMIELELPGNYVLVATGLGFVRKEISFKATSDAMDLGDIELVGDINGLEEVVITGTMREVSRSDSPVSVEVITPALFRKNPSPSLFDAVGMVNGVRPQINCSVCNTGDIHINGMEGPYTCLLYTSDAADERSSVDLGGRRIIKKKKKIDSNIHAITQKKRMPLEYHAENTTII